MGFIIDKTDGEALIGILEKYRDDWNEQWEYWASVGMEEVRVYDVQA